MILLLNQTNSQAEESGFLLHLPQSDTCQNTGWDQNNQKKTREKER